MPAALGVPRDAACEIRFGQIGLAQLRVRAQDPARVRAELAAKVAEAPQLFARAGVCLDLSALPATISEPEVVELLDAVRGAGLIPVGLAYGTSEVAAIAERLRLPVLAKFRAAYDRAGALVGGAEAPTAQRPVEANSVGASAPPTALRTDAAAVDSVGALIHAQAVRSGQQVHARGRDLVVVAAVGAGAEVIADGSLHVYGPLRGRALAGARGDATARIFCTEFEAELVAIAGVFKVFESVPAELRGKSVQVRLDRDSIVATPL